MSAVLSGVTCATNDECALRRAHATAGSAWLKKAAPEFFPGAAVKIAPKLLWPWWRCSFFGLFLSMLRLSLAMLCSSRHSSSRRPAGLIKARTWLSRAMRFASGAAHGRRADGMTQPRWRSLFSAASLAFPGAHWRRSAEALTFKCLAAILR